MDRIEDQRDRVHTGSPSPTVTRGSSAPPTSPSMPVSRPIAVPSNLPSNPVSGADLVPPNSPTEIVPGLVLEINYKELEATAPKLNRPKTLQQTGVAQNKVNQTSTFKRRPTGPNNAKGAQVRLVQRTFERKTFAQLANESLARVRSLVPLVQLRLCEDKVRDELILDMQKMRQDSHTIARLKAQYPHGCALIENLKASLWVDEAAYQDKARITDGVRTCIAMGMKPYILEGRAVRSTLAKAGFDLHA